MASKGDGIVNRGIAWRQNRIPNKDIALVSVYFL